MKSTDKSSLLPAIMLATAVLSVGVACFVSSGLLEPTKPAVAKGTKITKATTDSTIPDFQLGEIVTVKSSCVIFKLSATPEIATTVERYALAGDSEGFMELLRADLVYAGDPGDHVRIIGFQVDPEATRRLGSDTTWVQARFVDGNYKGCAGWGDASRLKR